MEILVGRMNWRGNRGLFFLKHGPRKKNSRKQCGIAAINYLLRKKNFYLHIMRRCKLCLEDTLRQTCQQYPCGDNHVYQSRTDLLFDTLLVIRE